MQFRSAGGRKFCREPDCSRHPYNTKLNSVFQQLFGKFLKSFQDIRRKSLRVNVLRLGEIFNFFPKRSRLSRFDGSFRRIFLVSSQELFFVFLGLFGDFFQSLIRFATRVLTQRTVTPRSMVQAIAAVEAVIAIAATRRRVVCRPALKFFAVF